MRCPNCGTELSEGSKFCKNCGMRLTYKPGTGGSRGYVIGVTLTILAIAAAALLWFAVTRAAGSGSELEAMGSPSTVSEQPVESGAPASAPSHTEAVQIEVPVETDTPAKTEATVVVDKVVMLYEGRPASGGELYMYSISSRLVVEAEITSSGTIPAEDIVWESSDTGVAGVIPSDDGLSCTIIKRGDGECVVTVAVGEKSDSVNIISTAKTGVTGVTSENLFERMPDYFYFSSNAGGWWTVLYIDDDGSFTGEYIDADFGFAGYEEFEGVPIYVDDLYYRYCSFSGQLEVVEQVGSKEFRLRITEISYDHEPWTWEDFVLEDGEHEVYMYTEPHGLTESRELYLYLPGRETADLDEDFLNWMIFDSNDFEIRENLKYWGIYAPKDGVAFLGMNGTLHGEPATA